MVRNQEEIFQPTGRVSKLVGSVFICCMVLSFWLGQVYGATCVDPWGIAAYNPFIIWRSLSLLQQSPWTYAFAPQALAVIGEYKKELGFFAFSVAAMSIGPYVGIPVAPGALKALVMNRVSLGIQNHTVYHASANVGHMCLGQNKVSMGANRQQLVANPQDMPQDMFQAQPARLLTIPDRSRFGNALMGPGTDVTLTQAANMGHGQNVLLDRR